MIQVVKLEREHLEQLMAQEPMAHMRQFVTDEHMTSLVKNEFSFGVINACGRVVACLGISQYWRGRAEGWALFDKGCRREFFSIHRAVAKFLQACPIKRIEAAVDVSFENGHRWVRALGFELEAPVMKAYMPHGGDCSLYARVG